MCGVDRLIAQIAASSGVPSAGRRREIVRELNAHVEDFVEVARREGHSGEEIERMVLAQFGDPRRCAANFAWVYRRERAGFRIALFALGTVAVTAAVFAAVFVMQCGAALGPGNAPWKTLSSRHTAIELIDILATAAAYIGLLSLESLFEARRLPKAIAILLPAAGAFAALARVRPAFLIFGCVNAIVLRWFAQSLPGWRFRLAAALAYFGIAGLVVLPHSAASLATLSSWLIMGAGYHLMTIFGAVVDRELSGRLPQR